MSAYWETFSSPFLSFSEESTLPLPAKSDHCAKQTNSVAVFSRNGLLSEGYISRGGRRAVFLMKSLTSRQNSNHSCHQFLDVVGRICGCGVFVVLAEGRPMGPNCLLFFLTFFKRWGLTHVQ